MWEEKGDTNKNYPVEKACEKYQLIFPEGEDFHEDFKNRLDETDRKILELRAAGHSQKEIAEKVGFKVPSAVSKRIEKIANQFEDFVCREYGEFLDKHIE